MNKFNLRMEYHTEGLCYLLQTILVEFSSTGRGTENRSYDGVFRTTILPTEPGYLHERRHMLRTKFRDNYVEHIPPQSQCKGQALTRTVRGHEQRDQQRRRPTAGVALSKSHHNIYQTLPLSLCALSLTVHKTPAFEFTNT